jgi:hypothetical protein
MRLPHQEVEQTFAHLQLWARQNVLQEEVAALELVEEAHVRLGELEGAQVQVPVCERECVVDA